MFGLVSNIVTGFCHSLFTTKFFKVARTSLLLGKPTEMLNLESERELCMIQGQVDESMSTGRTGNLPPLQPLASHIKKKSNSRGEKYKHRVPDGTLMELENDEVEYGLPVCAFEFKGPLVDITAQGDPTQDRTSAKDLCNRMNYLFYVPPLVEKMTNNGMKMRKVRLYPLSSRFPRL